MNKRAKVLAVCGTFDKELEECLEWYGVLKDELDKGVKCNIEIRRVETLFCIMDFVVTKPIFCKEYQYILPETCDSEEILAIAIGEIKS